MVLLLLLSLSCFGLGSALEITDLKTSSILGSCCKALDNATALLQCTNATTNSLSLSHARTSTVGGKPSIALVTYTTKSIWDYSAYSLTVNAAYAALHGYSFSILSPETQSEYEKGDQRWNKVRILLDAIQLPLETSEQSSSSSSSSRSGGGWAAHFDYIVWLDADLVFLDPLFSLEDVILDASQDQDIDIDLIISRDPYPEEVHSVVNTGMLIARNSDWTRQFLQKWWNMGDAGTATAHASTNTSAALRKDDDRDEERGSDRDRGEFRGAGLWDQHVFTKLYYDIDEASRSRISLLAPHAINTHRPATEFQQPSHPVLHMVGSVMFHRTAVFRKGLTELCLYSQNSENSENSKDSENSQNSTDSQNSENSENSKDSQKSSSREESRLSPQIGLDRISLVQIEQEVLGRRGIYAQELLQRLISLQGQLRQLGQLQSQGMGTSDNDESNNKDNKDNKMRSLFSRRGGLGAELGCLKEDVDDVMKLGDPRQGETAGVVRDVMVTWLELLLALLRHERALDLAHEVENHAGLYQGQGRGLWLHEWALDAAFEMCVRDAADAADAHTPGPVSGGESKGRGKTFTWLGDWAADAREVMESVQFVTEELAVFLTVVPGADEGVRDSSSVKRRSLYFEFKRLSIIAQTYRVQYEQQLEQVQVQDQSSPKKSGNNLLSLELEASVAALEIWNRLEGGGESNGDSNSHSNGHSNSPGVGERDQLAHYQEEACAIMDNTAVLFCLKGDTRAGLQLARRSALLALERWGVDHAHAAAREVAVDAMGAVSTAGIGVGVACGEEKGQGHALHVLMPAAAKSSLARTYVNAALCRRDDRRRRTDGVSDPRKSEVLPPVQWGVGGQELAELLQLLRQLETEERQERKERQESSSISSPDKERDSSGTVRKRMRRKKVKRV